MTARKSSRDQFVGEVVATIKDAPGDSEAFIFGISGKWGEGKTTFLDKLQAVIEAQVSKRMQVVKIHPWKYAHPDDSILRELLQGIVDLHPKRAKRFWLGKKLQALYHDTSRSKVNWPVIIGTAVLFGVAGFLYKVPWEFLADFQSFVAANKVVFTALLIPVLLAAANAVTVSQLSVRAVATRDRFNELFDEITKDLDLDKIVVFVDDLDRLTAVNALSVLDGLRTFFDKKQLVFIVASDHTVLERHLGRELLPSAGEAEQLEEGRRFLKKIFNVYWRLPIPTKPEFESYIKSLVSREASSLLHEKLRNDRNRKQLREYLSRYFSNNFRNTERFVKRLEFTFKIIESQYDAHSTTQRNNEYFKEMIDNPLLVVRILLIEELANPLFEKMQHDASLLLTLEREATTHGDPFAGGADSSYLSPEQGSFIRSFTTEKPRFNDETGVRVKSIEPYVFLSSDSSFGDIRGLSPEDFTSYLQSGRTEELSQILATSSEGKLKEAMEQFESSLNIYSEPVEKEKLLTSLIQVALKTNQKLSAPAIIKEGLVKYDFGFLDPLDPVAKLRMIQNLGGLFGEDDPAHEQVLSHIPGYRPTDWALIDSIQEPEERFSGLAQKKFLEYFKTYFASNPNDLITQLGTNIHRFTQGNLSATLGSMTSVLSDQIVSNPNNSISNVATGILENIEGGIDVLKESLRAQVRAKNSNIFNWLAEPSRSAINPLLTREELVENLMEGLNNSSPIAELNERLNMAHTIPEAKDDLWDVILRLDQSYLLAALYEMALINSHITLAPTSDVANNILEMVIRTFVTQEHANDSDTYNWLTRITPQQWIFANLKLAPATKKLLEQRSKTQYIPENVRNELARILGSF